MENIQQEADQVGAARVPSSQPIKTLSKIINNRYFNQNIYTLFLQKRYQQALSLISKCQPDEFKLYIQSLIAKNNYRLQQSLQLLNECLVMNKLNFAYLKSISKTYYLLGKYKSSLEAAKDAYRINSNDYQLFYILGKISLALGDRNDALSNFKSSISKQPNQESFLQIAKMNMNNHEFIQAADILRQCCITSPQNPDAYEFLAICEHKMGKNDQALQHYRQSLEVDARKYNSLMGLGAITLEKGQIDEALQTFKKAYATSSNSSVLWNDVGVAMKQKNKLVAAYSCFKRALFLDPFKWDIHANLALLFMEKKKYLPAQIHLRSALKLNKDSTLYNLLGICLSQLKDFGNAEKAFEEAVRMQVNNDEFRYNLVLSSIKNGNSVRAKKMFQELNSDCQNSNVRGRLYNLKQQLQAT